MNARKRREGHHEKLTPSLHINRVATRTCACSCYWDNRCGRSKSGWMRFPPSTRPSSCTSAYLIENPLFAAVCTY